MWGGPRGVPLRALSEQAEWRGAQRESGCPAAARCWSRRPSCMHSCPRGCPWPASPVGPGVGVGAEERAQEVVAKARVPSGALGLPAALLLPRSGAGENTCCRMLEKLCPADRSRTGDQVCLGAPSVPERVYQCVLAATALCWRACCEVVKEARGHAQGRSSCPPLLQWVSPRSAHRTQTSLHSVPTSRTRLL